MIASFFAPRRVRRVLFVIVLPALASCASLLETSSTMPTDWLQTVESRKQITSWKLRGRLGVQTETTGGSVDLWWNQQGETYTIRLIAAMGQGTLLIRGDENGVSIRSAEGEQYASDADAVLASSLGIEIPVTGLRNWIRGIPISGLAATGQQWDGQGQLHRLVQANWNIEMNQYQAVGGHMLPHAFYLERDDQPELSIRLVIRQWQAGPS